jgi:hypothetical protein
MGPSTPFAADGIFLNAEVDAADYVPWRKNKAVSPKDACALRCDELREFLSLIGS